jgi:hypothetical protein
MTDSALLADVLPRNLSFKHAAQLWLAWDGASKPTDNPDQINELLLLVAEQTVGNRPGRIEPRALKRRQKSYPLLMANRTLAREKIKKRDIRKSLSKCHSDLTPILISARAVRDR